MKPVHRNLLRTPNAEHAENRTPQPRSSPSNIAGPSLCAVTSPASVVVRSSGDHGPRTSRVLRP